MSRGSKRTSKRREAEALGYRSDLERKMADFLSVKGIRFTYEDGTVDYVSPVKGGVCLLCPSKTVGKRRRYVPDFRVGPIVLETKGKLDSPGRTKLIAIKASNPKLDIRLVFQRDNRIRRGSDTYYSDWARDHGFKYCIGTELPARWVKELKKVADDKRET